MDQAPKFEVSLTTLRGTWWMYLARYGGKPLSLITTLLLVRLLSAEDWGTAAFALSAVGFLAPLSDWGIGAALIYRRDGPDMTATAFGLALVSGLALLVVAWIGAPLVGAFFHDPWAIEATRVLALTFPLSALGTVYESLLQKRLRFGGQVPPSLLRVLSKGVFAVALAAAGYGPWSLIWSQVGSVALWLLAYVWLVPWQPSLGFSFGHAQAIFSYSKHLVAVNVLAAFLISADFFFVGHVLGASMLGLYTVGFRLPDLLMIQFCSIVSKVVFPIYVRINADAEALSRSFVQSIRFLSLVTIPLGLGMALVAEPLVLTFLGNQWLAAVPVVRAIALYGGLVALERQTSSVLKAGGRVPVLLALTIMRAAVLVPALWWAATVLGTIGAVAWTNAGVGVVGSAVYLLTASRLLGVGSRAMLGALLPAASCALLMGLAVVGVLAAFVAQPPGVQLVVSVALGGAVYAAASYWLQREAVLRMRGLFAAALGRA